MAKITVHSHILGVFGVGFNVAPWQPLAEFLLN